MSLLLTALLAAIGLGAAALAAALIRFNIKRKQIIRAAATATAEQLEEIYSLVESCGSLPCQGFVLGRTNRTLADASCVIEIPATLGTFPWAGRAVNLRVPRDPEFSIEEPRGSGTRLLGRIYRPVAVPRVKSKSGKQRNRFDPGFYLQTNPPLREKLQKVCAKYPDELLGYLLCAGRESFEFDPIDQGRIGTTPAWVQGAEVQHCDQCHKRMLLIVQVPGTLLDKKALHNGTFYLFGCKDHPDKTATVAQFT